MAKFSHYPTRREKDYFAVPNRIYSCGLDAVAIVIYCYLLFNQYGKWFPPLVDREKLAAELKLSDAVIDKRIRLLVARNLVCQDEDYLYVVQKRENRPWNFWLKPKEEEIKNHFLLPKEVFTLDLSAGEIAVYGYLLCCENRVTYQCYPGYQTIGDAVGMSRNTVMKYVKALVDKRLIYTESTTVWGKDGMKRNGTLLYTIRPIYEAMADTLAGSALIPSMNITNGLVRSRMVKPSIERSALTSAKAMFGEMVLAPTHCELSSITTLPMAWMSFTHRLGQATPVCSAVLKSWALRNAAGMWGFDKWKERLMMA